MVHKPYNKPGPKPAVALKKEYHFKFPADIVAHIERSATTGYHAYVESLIRKDMAQQDIVLMDVHKQD